MKEKMRLFFFTVILVAASFLAPIAYAQLAKNKMNATMLDSVIIDVESDLNVNFIEKELSKYTVKTSDLPWLEENPHKKAAVVRITGGQAEMMVDIGREKIEGKVNSGIALSLYDFNIAEEGAGTAVTVIPKAEENSFILSIGGTVEGEIESGYYNGINLLCINYL
jgi:hypothetical protein